MDLTDNISSLQYKLILREREQEQEEEVNTHLGRGLSHNLEDPGACVTR
jgi:hypothetical protein